MDLQNKVEGNEQLFKRKVKSHVYYESVNKKLTFYLFRTSQVELDKLMLAKLAKKKLEQASK